MLTMRKVMMGLKQLGASLLALAIVTMPALADETATLSIKSIPNVNVRMYGFVENDLINDSTQGLVEELDNPTLNKASVYAGQHHQTIMSIRNSRLGFDVTMPKTENGLETEGIFEFDALGNGAGTTQRDTFNNGSIRVRHLYANITDSQWNAKIGQTWSLLGWQPYYFPSEDNVSPAIGQAYRRFAQIRVTNTQKIMNDEWTFESALDAARPAETQSGLTTEHAGLRLASTKYKAVSGLGSSTPLVGLSAAVSGELIPIRTQGGNANGSAVALDALVPIIPSSDGKSTSNTLAVTAEYTNGRGYGGLEVPFSTASGATSGVPTTYASSGVTLDSGMAGTSSSGNLCLLHFQTYRGDVTYMLPGSHWGSSLGYAATEALNLTDYTASPNFISKYQYFYVNAMYLPLSWLRFALQLGQVKDTFTNNGIFNGTTQNNDRYAYDNRIQFTTYLTF